MNGARPHPPPRHTQNTPPTTRTTPAAPTARARTRARLGHKLLGYGLLGWCLEITFTGLSNAIHHRDPTLKGQTYLWMLPIYAAGGLLLERIHLRLTPRVPRPLRALTYLGAIYATEYTTGLLLRRLTGQCPWDYTDRGLNVHGLIRLDYAPYWYACALLFEPARDLLDKAYAGLLDPTDERTNRHTT